MDEETAKVLADEAEGQPAEPEEQQEPEVQRETLGAWARRNKRYLIAVGAGIAVGAATVAVIKEREKIAAAAQLAGKTVEQGYLKAVKEAPKLAERAEKAAARAEKAAEKAAGKVAGKVADSKAVEVSAEALGNLAEKASALIDAGKKLGKSVDDVREFLADADIAEKLPQVKDVLPQVGKFAAALAKAALQIAAKK